MCENKEGDPYLIAPRIPANVIPSPSSDHPNTTSPISH